MKKIPLTQGRFALVDDDDYEYLMQWKWRYNDGYAVRSYRISGKCKVMMMHRQILNPPLGVYTDHINLDGLDNRKCNLRECDSSQNMANQQLPSTNTTGYKGICWDKQYQKWRAVLGYKNKKVNIGRYDTKEEAARAYDLYAKAFFGEYARLNFSDDPKLIALRYS